MKGVAKMEIQKFYKEVYDRLSLKDIMIIFKSFLQCPECGGCENCALNEIKFKGRSIGCLKLRDIAMQVIIDNSERCINDANDQQ